MQISETAYQCSNAHEYAMNAGLLFGTLLIISVTGLAAMYLKFQHYKYEMEYESKLE